jgi:hypothetical protein
MKLAIRNWLDTLKQQAEAHGLEHLDIVIDATNLDYPLLQRVGELDPAPQTVLLLEGTPEHALASIGPILIRVSCVQPLQMEWLGACLTEISGDSRGLVLLSHWPIEALAEHLRYCTQAQFNNGANSGILRFYDIRLFKHISNLFWGEDSWNFHAPVISWHWIDRDQKEQALGGSQYKLNEFTRPETPLMLNEGQVEAIHLWTKAERWEDDHGLPNRNYWIPKEQRVANIYLGLIEASNQHLKGEESKAFMIKWLAERMPESPPAQDSTV